MSLPIVDGFGRVHTSFRISVTDRCNIRCSYCMPDSTIQFRARDQLLSFEEIVRVTRIAARMGIRRLRITGGEPLLRVALPKLVAMLRAIRKIDDLALTTNGLLLADHALALKNAGVDRLNISLDTLDAATFRQITRRDGLDRVLHGVLVARQVGFKKIRLNAVALRGVTEKDVVPLGRFARDHDLELRFIEFMPIDGDHCWHADQVLSGKAIRRLLEAEFGSLEPVHRQNRSQPAVDYRFADGGGTVGLICSVTQPFCRHCDRLRITAEGQLRNCLFSNVEWDARAVLRSGGSDQQISQLIRDCIAAKKLGHGSDQLEMMRPERAMYQIGG